MTTRNCVSAMLALVLVTASAGRSQNVLAVPGQFATIQNAINAATPGDTVLVGPRTYFERIDFIGKAVTVQGAGAGASFIDAGQLGSVVAFQDLEGPGSVLDGFTGLMNESKPSIGSRIMLVDISQRQIYDSTPDRSVDCLNQSAIAEPIMTLRKFAIAAIASVAAIAGCAAMPSWQERGDERLPLRVVYAGNAGTSYTAAWEEFLKRHVASVRVVAAATLSRDDLREADVLIVDGEIQKPLFGGTQVIESIRLGLDDLQGFPVVLVGGTGALLASSLHLKPSWG